MANSNSFVSIIEKQTAKVIINKSTFIAYAMPISDINEITEIIKSIQLVHPDATHYCYAACTVNSAKCSDDGEPSGTAGVPILEIIRKKGLVNIAVIVVRYYGGIKLGSGGLIRAYSQSAASAIDICQRVEYFEMVIATVTISYPLLKPLNNAVSSVAIPIDTCYDLLITVNYKLLAVNKDKFTQIVNDITGAKADIFFSQTQMLPLI